MRISKRQLRRIIKEEKAKLISEQPGPYGQTILDDLTIQVEEIIDNAVGQADMDGTPLTKREILDHVVRMLQEQR